MKRVQRFGRRKNDRVILLVAILGVLAMVLTYTQACEKTGPTTPEPVVQQPAPTVAAPAPTTTTPTVVTPPADDPDFVHSWRGLTLTIEAKRVREFRVRIFTHQGANIWNQTKVYDTDKGDGPPLDVKRGHNEFNFQWAKAKWPGCRLQIDIGNLLTYKWIDGGPCDPPCVEWEEPKVEEKCGDFGECHEHPTATHVTASVPVNGCYEHQECVRIETWNCKEPTETPFENTEPCDCPCKEGGPYVGDPIWDEEILEGGCEVQASTGRACHQNGTQKTTWDCQKPTEAPVCRPVDCPVVCVDTNVVTVTFGKDDYFKVTVNDAEVFKGNKDKGDTITFNVNPGDVIKTYEWKTYRWNKEAEKTANACPVGFQGFEASCSAKITIVCECLEP